MVAGLGSLGNGDDSMMLKYIEDIKTLDAYQKTSKTNKDEESSSAEDVFGQIIDEINANIEKVADQQAGITSPLGDTSNAQFGPPSGMDIDGLDVDSLNAVELISDYGDINTGTSSSESVANSQSAGGGADGSGGDNEDSEDENDPMDLNGDGTVTTQEMLAYFQMQNSSYTQDGASNVLDEAIDLML